MCLISERFMVPIFISSQSLLSDSPLHDLPHPTLKRPISKFDKGNQCTFMPAWIQTDPEVNTRFH